VDALLQQVAGDLEQLAGEDDAGGGAVAALGVLVLATSMTILAAGCATSISFRMVAPSLVMTTSPIESTSILSMPRGPRVDLTVSAMRRAA